jgi:hypothetical protein
MSLKFRLPTWRLHTTKPYDSKTDTKLRLIRSGCCNSKWFSQRPLLSEKQRGTKISAPTLTATFWSYCCSCWCWSWEVGDGVLQLLKLEVVAEVYVVVVVVVDVVLVDDDDDFTFNFCTEFTRNYALSLLRYFAPETKRITFPLYSLFPGWTIDLISKTTSFNTKLYFRPLHSLSYISYIYTQLLYFPPLHSFAIFSAITLTCYIFHHYTHLLYFPPLHSLAIFPTITLTCYIFRYYTHLLYFPPLHSLAVSSTITLTSHGRLPLTNFLYFHSEFFNFIWFFLTQYINLIRFTKILYKWESNNLTNILLCIL